MAQYQRHLHRVFEDRSRYWSARTQSRLKQIVSSGNLVVSCIIDGIDHSKFRFPRSLVTMSKEMAAFVRPTMDMVACLAHGHGVWMIPTLPHVAKDSSLTVDILTHVLHSLAERGVDCRTVDFRLQSDNTTRETKNNVTLRWLGFMIGSHRLRRGTLSCLSTGHSHEDIDQAFSVVSNWIQREKELHVPEHFCKVLERLLADSTFRLQDCSIRKVHLVSAVREWYHD